MIFKDTFEKPSETWFYGNMNMADKKGHMRVRDRFCWPHFFITPTSRVINPKVFSDFEIDMEFEYLPDIEKPGAVISLFKELEFLPDKKGKVFIAVDLDNYW